MSLRDEAGTRHENESTDQVSAATIPDVRIRLELITPGRYNRPIEDGPLQELAASVKSIGVLEPILIRPLPADRLEETARLSPRPTYEIIAGERRFRAATLAGLAEIPARVMLMTDAEVAEARIVENLQREGLHPLDEADAYQRLIDDAGIAKEDIASKIGKGRTYVYDRLKLLRLTPTSRQAFRDGKLDASRAELLGTLADSKLQEKALGVFTEKDWQGQDPKLSYRQCKSWLKDNILLKIKEAPFNTKREDLVEGCGACTACPKRSRASEDLLATFEDGPDLCLDPPCYRKKEAASLAEIKEKAAEQGLEVIAGPAAKKLKDRWGNEIKGYTRMDAKHADGKGGEATIAKLLGKDAPAPKLFVDPETQKTIKVLPTEVVGELLKERGLVSSTKGERDRKAEAARERADAKAAIELRARELGIEQVSERIAGGALSAFSAPVLRMLLQAYVPSQSHCRLSRTEQELLLRLWRLPAVESNESYDWKAEQKRCAALHARVQAATDIELGPMLLQYLVADEFDRVPEGGGYLQQLAGETGVDLQACEALAKQEHKERLLAAKKPAGAPEAHADSEESPGATSEAAPQGSKAARGKKAQVEEAAPEMNAAAKAWPFPGGPATGRKPRAKKISATEAQQGIAEAMQGDAQPGEAGGLQQYEAAEADRAKVAAMGEAVLAKILEGMPHVDAAVLANLQAGELADPRKLLELTVDQIAGATGLDVDQAGELLRALESWPWATVLAARRLQVGNQVRVLEDESFSASTRRWVGKTGEVVAVNSDAGEIVSLDVSFKLPKGGKVMSFLPAHLEVVQ